MALRGQLNLLSCRSRIQRTVERQGRSDCSQTAHIAHMQRWLSLLPPDKVKIPQFLNVVLGYSEKYGL